MNPLNKEFHTFLVDLAANNNREWFHDNKSVYEKHVKKAFQSLVSSLIIELGLDLEVKNAVFRINRDIRFSKDKRPYKTHMSCVLSPFGRKNMEYPGLYLHLEPENLMIGGGAYQPSKENLYKIRTYISENPEEMYRILSEDAFVKTFGELEGEKNKILPKEFKEAGQSIPLLFNKGFFYMASYTEPEAMLRPDLVEFILEHEKIGRSWNNYLIEAIRS